MLRIFERNGLIVASLDQILRISAEIMALGRIPAEGIAAVIGPSGQREICIRYLHDIAITITRMYPNVSQFFSIVVLISSAWCP